MQELDLSDCVYCNGDTLSGRTYKLSKPLFDTITPSIIHLTQVLGIGNGVFSSSLWC